MKTTKSILPSVLTMVFACLISCSDQNEEMSVSQKNVPLVSKNQHKPNSNARIEGYKFDGTEGDPIDLVTAKRWKANFKETTQSPEDILGHFFGTEGIQQLLNEAGCVGIRIYYALDDEGNKKLLLVGVDENGDDLIPSETESLDGEGNIILDYSWPCPDYCPGPGGNEF
jgi:hypothetical protein